MKRILIVGLVIFGVWFLFHDETPTSEIKEQEVNTLEEEETSTEGSEKETENAAEEVEAEAESSDEVKIEVEANVKEKKTWTRRRPRRRYSQAPEETIIQEVEKAAVPVKTSTQAFVAAPVAAPDPVEEQQVALPTTKVKVYLYEWNIDFSRSAIPEGTVQFEVQNNGIFSHHFALDGGDNFGKVKPGETRVFETTVEPGTFRIYSPREIDQEHNMDENFIVYEF